MRRQQWAQAPASRHERARVLKFGRAAVDFEAHAVKVDDKDVSLTALAPPGRVLRGAPGARAVA